MTKAASPVMLLRWRVMRVKIPAYIAHRFYAVGYVDALDDGFVSGAVRRYNADARLIVTSSGDKVHLSGPQGGLSRDADRVWGTFLRKRRVTESVDVSSRYTAPAKRRRAKPPGQSTAKA